VPLGTLGKLDHAARAKLLRFEDAIAVLRATNFRYPADVVDRLLAEHRG